MEKGHTKSKKIIFIPMVIAVIIIIGIIVFLHFRDDDKVSFDSNDKAYFAMFANMFEPEEYEFESLDAYYLSEIRTFYYNAKYTMYSPIGDTWYDIDEVSYGSIGHFENSYCLSWDSLYGFEEVDRDFKRAVTEGVHKTYTAEEIQAFLETAYQEKEVE